MHIKLDVVSYRIGDFMKSKAFFSKYLLLLGEPHIECTYINPFQVVLDTTVYNPLQLGGENDPIWYEGGHCVLVHHGGGGGI